MLVDNDSSSVPKTFEENSSDMEDLDDKLANKQKQAVENIPTVASRRPIRKKTKPKNEDFEYDLSNLLKMEAQGYRDSQSVANTKSTPNKKKAVQSDNQIYYDSLNKECCGALATLSKKAVENSAAHMKSSSFLLQKGQKESRPPNIFVRPMLPKVVVRNEKISPKKDIVEDIKDIPNVEKQTENEKTNLPSENTSTGNDKLNTSLPDSSSNTNSINKEEKTNSGSGTGQLTKKNVIPAVVPIKFRRQSLEVIKNSPILNKNLTDFTKAGMKTKILVIKPINRSKDGATAANATLKFQTIKLKDPSKGSTSKELNSVLVKVPKVDRAPVRAINDLNNKSGDKMVTTEEIKQIDTVKKDINDTSKECDKSSNEKPLNENNNCEKVAKCNTISNDINSNHDSSESVDNHKQQKEKKSDLEDHNKEPKDHNCEHSKKSVKEHSSEQVQNSEPVGPNSELNYHNSEPNGQISEPNAVIRPMLEPLKSKIIVPE